MYLHVHIISEVAAGESFFIYILFSTRGNLRNIEWDGKQGAQQLGILFLERTSPGTILHGTSFLPFLDEDAGNQNRNHPCFPQVRRETRRWKKETGEENMVLGKMVRKKENPAALITKNMTCSPEEENKLGKEGYKKRWRSMSVMLAKTWQKDNIRREKCYYVIHRRVEES